MMRFLKLAFLVLPLYLAAAENNPAVATPNFSGYWKLDAEKSNFGGAEAPDSAGYVIRHIGGKLTFDYTQDSHTSRVEVTTDGQERMTDSNADMEIWTRAFWDGPVLVFEARQRPRPAHESSNIRWTSRWKLAEDGKTLRIERQITAPQAQLKQTLVFNRETRETSENKR